MFCKNCGNEVDDKAVICISCGVPIKTANPRSRAVAVVLAVLLGFWTWLYTYKNDAWKFWLAFGFTWGTTILTFGLLFPLSAMFTVVFWIWAIIDQAVKDAEFYANYGSV